MVGDGVLRQAFNRELGKHTKILNTIPANLKEKELMGYPPALLNNQIIIDDQSELSGVPKQSHQKV